MKLHHTGYITGDIDGTANVFEVLGYRKCKTYDDINQKCFICFLESVVPSVIKTSIFPIFFKVGSNSFPLYPWFLKSPVCKIRFPSASIRSINALYALWSTIYGVIDAILRDYFFENIYLLTI